MTTGSTSPPRTSWPRQPRPRSTRIAILSAVAGVVLAVVWSPTLVDGIIAGGIAGPLFGDDLASVPLDSTSVALTFAVVTGVAGMFTACNIAVFSALVPLSARPESGGPRWRSALRPVGQLLAGAVTVAGLYGIVGVYLPDSAAQLSDERLGDPGSGLPVRMVQAAVVFGLIGAVMLWRGLSYAGLVRNPLAGLFARRPWVETVLLGGLIGAFLIGRPYPPFRHLFAYAAATDNPAIGFATFALQSAGNVLGVVALYLIVLAATRGRLQRWLMRDTGRSDRMSAAAFVAVGVFFIVYWLVRLAPRAGLMWWPMMPWNA